VFVPLAILVALYYRITGLDRSLPFAALALLLSATFALATETLVQRERRPGLMAVGAMFATGTLAALALTFALEKGWLTVGLAPDGARRRLDRGEARCPGCAGSPPSWSPLWWRGSPMSRAAMILERRRSSTGCFTATAYRRFHSGSPAGCCGVGALIMAALTLLAIVFSLPPSPAGFANTPVTGAFFNRILVGYGLPAVLALTLALIARTTRPLPYRVVAAIAAVTLALFYLTLEVRRLFHGPILGGPTRDAEQY
jgi:uncharacterized membrane protein